MKENEMLERAIVLKLQFGKEFQATADTDYTSFCFQRLKKAKLNEEQQIVATALIDLAIGIGRLQMMSEFYETQQKLKTYVIPFEEPKVSG
jgi:hypothetical protein